MEEKKQELVKKAKPLAVSPFARSRVDILVPFHGQYEKVTKLVEGILYAVRSNPYLITLIDDGSPNKSFSEDLRSVPQVNVVRSENHEGFGAALYKGYAATKQPWIMIMHSDCSIEDPTWMIKMGECLVANKKQGVKMVSARTDNPGVGVDSRLKGDRDNVQEDVILNDTHLPLFAAMCHRDLFNHIGGFIKPYPYAGYEDEELAWRMRSFGFKQAICGDSWVRHEGGATIRALKSEGVDMDKITEENYERCLADVRAVYSKKQK